MAISVFIERRNEKLILKGKMKIQELLEKIKANPVESVVSLNGEIVTEDAVAKDGDQVEIFSVVSGG
jgi:thiamine biosynthesis protein ThiS